MNLELPNVIMFTLTSLCFHIFKNEVAFYRSDCSRELMYTVRGICLSVCVMERCAAFKPQPCPLPTKHRAIIKNVVLASVSPFCLIRVETHIAPNNYRSFDVFSCCGPDLSKKTCADLSLESNSLPGLIRTNSWGGSLHSLLIDLVLKFPLVVT